MSTVFSTPASTGFNRRGPHPAGGQYYGGATTAEGGLVRGGPLVLREMEWFNDETGDSERAPVLVTSTYGPVAEKIGVEGFYLMSGKFMRSWKRMWPGGSTCKPLKNMPAYMDSDDVYIIDEEWPALFPLQDLRGSIRAVPLRLHSSGEIVNGAPTPGTIILAGALRSVLGVRVFEPVRATSVPVLTLAFATTARVCALNIEPADAFGARAASFPRVLAGAGPAIPGTGRRHVLLGADAERGFIDGAIIYGAPGAPVAVAVVAEVAADGRALRCWCVITPLRTGDDDPAYGGRDGEVILSEQTVEVPLANVRGQALIVTRQLYTTIKGSAGCPLFWFERKQLPCGRQLQFYPPPDAELDNVLTKWAGAGMSMLYTPRRPTAATATKCGCHHCACALCALTRR